MKKSFTFLSIIAVFAILFASCSKDNSSGPGPSGGGGGNKPYIKMKINGREWYDETVAVSGVSFFEGEYNASVVGTNENFEGAKSGLSIIFSSTSDITTGTYNIKDYDGGVSVTKVNDKTYLMTSSTASASFSVTITDIQSSGSVRRIKGTFSGTLPGPTAGDMITITDGEFVGY